MAGFDGWSAPPSASVVSAGSGATLVTAGKKIKSLKVVNASLAEAPDTVTIECAGGAGVESVGDGTTLVG